jgi:hypothetical protein
MKILWLSRHPPTEDQKEELSSVCCLHQKDTGESKNIIICENCGTHVSEETPVKHEIKQISQSFNSADEIAALMKEEKADAIVAVLPLPLIADLCDLDITPIRAMMSRKMNEQGEAVFKHICFEVVEEVMVKTRDL